MTRPRRDLLLPFYCSLANAIGVSPTAAQAVEVESVETLAPHPRLRRMLQSDPAMAALLPGAAGRFALCGSEHFPFALPGTNIILLPAVLLDDAAALSVAARWGLEAAHARDHGNLGTRQLVALVRHGAALIDALPGPSRNLVLQLLPPAIGAELWAGRGCTPSDRLLAWQAKLIEGALVNDALPCPPHELEGTVEQLLVAGGDGRLRLDRSTGQNRYGVPPRPRPEAVHFSSSTASAVSDYGFLFCDLLRRDLHTAHQVLGVSIEALRGRAADATGRAIASLLGLGTDEADVAVTPSGTDAELLAVLVSRAGAAGRVLTNVLLAPEESGRGVLLAGSGCFFDDVAATGAPIAQGSPAFPEAPVPVCKVAIRDDAGLPRTAAAVDADFLAAGRAALARGHHVLAHMLLASKTGLSAPSCEALEELVAVAPERVDIVVDACQMRTPFAELGAFVRRGWMVQVSGSKFLTGPPFSGALIVPPAMCGRAEAVGAELAAAPGAGHAFDWTHPWASRMPVAEGTTPSFGAIFRWLPALLEAQLIGALPENFRRAVFTRFRDSLSRRLAASEFLRPIVTGDDDFEGVDTLARLSIFSFQVLGRRWNGALEPLGEAACRRLFEQLNCDVTETIGLVEPSTCALARQQAHIGQPVTLGGVNGPVTVLRMVLGARFFTIIGYAGSAAVEAALLSEIADAQRAISKVEILAAHWWRLERSGDSA